MFLSSVKQFIDRHHLLHEGEAVAIALSGGADSVALLRSLHALGYTLVALHCNFHLRGEESNRDEQFVRSLCASLGVTLYVEHFDTKLYAETHRISIEMAARDLRYDWFERMRQQLNLQAIAVAHHRDDQAETLLLNIIRGTGIRGLCGMHPRNGFVVRPLLNVSRADILAYLQSLGQEYVTDSTNAELDARRNVLRLDVLPRLQSLNPDIHESLNRLAQSMQESLPIYQQGVSAIFSENGVGECFPLSLLQRDDALTLLFEWTRDKGFRTTQLQEMIEARASQPGRLWTSASHRILLDRDELVMETIAERPSLENYTIQVEPVAELGSFSDDRIYCDEALLDSPLTLRYVSGDESFVPFGMKGKRLISDFLTDLKVNRFQRARQLGLYCCERLVWLVGRRADNRFRVTKATQRIVCIKILTKTPCE